MRVSGEHEQVRSGLDRDCTSAVTLKHAPSEKRCMEGSDRFMLWALLLVTLLFLVGFGLILLGI